MTESIRELHKNSAWRRMRRILNLNQDNFWKAVGVTQSTGSRYESGRETPSQVRELLRLVYVEGIDITNLKREHVAEQALLKQPAA